MCPEEYHAFILKSQEQVLRIVCIDTLPNDKLGSLLVQCQVHISHQDNSWRTTLDVPCGGARWQDGGGPW